MELMDKSVQKLIIGYQKKQLESGMDVPEAAVADDVIDVQNSGNEHKITLIWILLEVVLALKYLCLSETPVRCAPSIVLGWRP